MILSKVDSRQKYAGMTVIGDEAIGLSSVCPQTPPVLSLRGTFLATKQSPSLYKGIASAKNTSQ